MQKGKQGMRLRQQRKVSQVGYYCELLITSPRHHQALCDGAVSSVRILPPLKNKQTKKGAR